jgi:hypothetical protein
MTSSMLPVGGDEDLRDLAMKRVKERRDFQVHLVAYVVVNLFLWGVWAITSGVGSYPWPLWVTLGWGIGVVLNAWGVMRRPITPADIDREIDRISRS